MLVVRNTHHELCWIKRIEALQVDGDGVKGRPKGRDGEKY